ncbi:MAG: hypothetical protein CMK72_17270 [Pseudomonadaceae bacterium]|nr:hypothetical protein [Pseudomonadaceae bacterium]HCP54521.1 hypothetical protein [Pseudomonas sp.]
MCQSQALLSIALELCDVFTRLRLTLFQCVEQIFKLIDCLARLGLRLGLTRLGGVLQFATRLVQFFLRFAALGFQLGQQFFSINQRLAARIFKVIKQAAGKLLK